MLPTNDLATITTALRRGTYSLLLGAGFSMSSLRRNGTTLPSSGALADEIATRFGLETGNALAAVAGAIEQEQALFDFLTAEFSGCCASQGAKLVGAFVWDTIYTLNIDDVLSDVYSSSDAKQSMRIRTFNDLYDRNVDVAETNCVHLHGASRRPQDGYVFSTSQYGRAIARADIWTQLLADELRTRPFIVIGCSLQEPDLETYLSRRQGLRGSQQISPALFVNRTITKVMRAQCKRFDMIPIEATTDDFFAELDRMTAPRPHPNELVVPQLFNKGSVNKSARVFFRQWLTIRQDELPAITTPPLPLLRGAEPRWSHIVSHDDIVRSDESALLREIADWHQSNARGRYELITSPGGEGKSTMLMRIGLELSKQGFLSFQYLGEDGISIDAARAVLSSLKQPVVLLLDHAAEQAAQMRALVEALDAEAVRYFLLAAERVHRIRRIQDSFPTGFPERTISKLSQGESLALVQQLRKFGLLGMQASRYDLDIARELTKQELLVAIVSVTGAQGRLSDVILGEWTSLPDGAKDIYSAAAIAHALGHPIALPILERAAGATAADATHHLQTTLRGLITDSTVRGAKETRHRVLSEELFRRFDAGYALKAMANLARALAPYVNPNTIRAGTPEARLTRKLMNFDDTIFPKFGDSSSAFYEATRSEWEWNSRYWEQRTVLELHRHDLTMARSYATHAVGIERHPHTLTTLAKVHFEIARVAGVDSERDANLDDGIAYAAEAIQINKRRHRTDVYPFDVLIRGIMNVIESDKQLRRKTAVRVNVREKLDEQLVDPELLKMYSDPELEALKKRAQSLR